MLGHQGAVRWPLAGVAVRVSFTMPKVVEIDMPEQPSWLLPQLLLSLRVAHFRGVSRLYPSSIGLSTDTLRQSAPRIRN